MMSINFHSLILNSLESIEKSLESKRKTHSHNQNKHFLQSLPSFSYARLLYTLSENVDTKTQSFEYEISMENFP